MAGIIETLRKREEAPRARVRFYHPRKAFKLTPLRFEERLTTMPGRATRKRVSSKLTWDDSVRLREVSCWIYLGFEPTMSELSTVFTVERGEEEPRLIIASVLRHCVR